MLKKLLSIGVVLAVVLPFGQAQGQARSYPTMDGGRTYIVPAEPAYVRVTIQGDGTLVVTTNTVNPNGTITPRVTTFPPESGGGGGSRGDGGGGSGGGSGGGGGGGGGGTTKNEVCTGTRICPKAK